MPVVYLCPSITGNILRLRINRFEFRPASDLTSRLLVAQRISSFSMQPSKGNCR